MVEIVSIKPAILSDKARVNFVENQFTRCHANERPCKGLVVDMENGHLVKLIAFDVPGSNQFAIKHYVKDEKGKLVTLPPDIITALYGVKATFHPFTQGQFSRSGSLEDAASYLAVVAKLPCTPHAKVSMVDPNFNPPIYPMLPWVRRERLDTADGVKLGG